VVTLRVWDADGPHASACEVSDDADAARCAAGEGMAATGANTATVQEVTHRAGGGWMRSAYFRTGIGWTARRNGDRIRWTKFRRSDRAAS
jgi:hypothetical protein